MRELLQQILVYVVIVSALKGLLLNKKYEEYFRFFSGTIMILILLSPVLSFLGEPSKWYQVLETNLLNMDVQEMKGMLKVTDDHLENMVQEKYSAALEKEVEALAKEQGIFLAETNVTFKKGKDGLEIGEVSGKKEEQSAEKEQKKIAIETIQMEDGKKKETEDHSAAAELLRKKISKKFNLAQNKVHIWE